MNDDAHENNAKQQIQEEKRETTTNVEKRVNAIEYNTKNIVTVIFLQIWIVWCTCDGKTIHRV